MHCILLGLLLAISLRADCQKYFLFIGSYTDSGSKGIYVYSFDASSGNTQLLSNTDGVVNPSFLTISPGGKYVYACTETRTENAGSISSFAFNRVTGALKFINKVPSGGDNPVYVSAHKNGRWLVCGNYTGGSISAFKVDEDGRIAAASQSIKHKGSSINPQRQDRSHVHSTVFSPDYKYLYVPDLGIDKVFSYQFSNKSLLPLQPSPQPYIATFVGSGPRHFAFHPNGKYAYLAEEMGGSVSVYKYLHGKLASIERIAAHPADVQAPFGAADIHVSPDGRFVYMTNRAKEDNIAIFSINQINGKLTLLGYEPTVGKGPRNFIIEPSGKYLLVANQQSGNVVVFKRDLETGLLQATGKQIQVPEASCLQMLKM